MIVYIVLSISFPPEKPQKKADLPSVRQPSVKELPHVEMKRSKVLVTKPEVQVKKKPSFLPPVCPPSEARQHVHSKSFNLQATQRSVVEVKIKNQGALVRDDPLMYLYSKSRRLSEAPACSTAVAGSMSPLLPSDMDLGCPVIQQASSSSLQTPLAPSPHPEYCRIQPSCGEGDANWRESLHKLVSLYGFRSKGAPPSSTRYQAPPVSLVPSEAMPPVPTTPEAPSKPAGQSALGQRVLHRTQLRETWEKTPTQFQHEVPLPWQLSSYTLCAQGKSRYGRLELDWVRSPEGDVPARHIPAFPCLTPACQAL